MAAIVSKSYDVKRAEFTAECRRLAELAFHRYCRCIHEPLYLVGTKKAGLDTHNPSAAIWERLSVASEGDMSTRPELVVVNGTPLSRACTLDALTDAIRGMLCREPLWIYAD